jgi:hypothetical protein
MHIYIYIYIYRYIYILLFIHFMTQCFIQKINEDNVTEEIDGNDDNDDDDDDSNNNSQQIEQQIELNFALGDFTDSAIALAEEAMKGESSDLDNKENEDVDDNDE